MVPLQPSLSLLVQKVVLVPVRRPDMSSVTRHVLENGNTHGSLLAVSQVPVALWISLELLGIERRHDSRVDRDQLVLLVPVADEAGAPTTIGSLLEKEAEAAVRLGIDLGSVNHKTLRDGRLHLGDGALRAGRYVGCSAVDAVHDEGALVHAGFGALDKVAPFHSARPGCVYVGIVVEYGGKVLPLACITGGENKLESMPFTRFISDQERLDEDRLLTGSRAILRQAL
jgi:hypothetical protein